MKIYAQCTPILLPYLNRAAALAQESPAIVSLGALLLVLIIAMQILAFFRRMMMFWIRLIVKLGSWGAIGILLGVVWQRGLGRTAMDLAAWTEELRAVWWREYRKWEDYQNRDGGLGQAQGRGGNLGSGGRGNAGSAWR